MIYFIGDIHGAIPSYLTMLSKVSPENISIQVGDIGLGLSGIEYNGPELPDQLSDNFRFLRGNHDNPTKCRLHKNFIGDFGVWHGIFCISGAETMRRDKDKVAGISWFKDEELDSTQWDGVIKLYEEIKPRIVCSHDCPQKIAERFFRVRGTSKTRRELQLLLELHQPDYWFFGHHDLSREEWVDGTIFVSLANLQVYELIPWWNSGFID